MKIGIFDHVSLRLGGSQLVVARMAALLSQRYDVEVIHRGKGYTLSRLAHAFEVDLTWVKERIVGDVPVSFSVPGPRSAWGYLREGLQADRALTEPYDLFIYSGHGAPPFSFAKQGLIYCHFPFESRPNVAIQYNERWQRRNYFDRWVRLALYERMWDRRMMGYAAVLANSNFTSGWIERLWGRRAEVVYPPVAVEVPKANKRNLIASVGRFIDTDRKNLTQQLQAFPQFLSRVRGDWSLCVIGFCSDFPQDRAYLEGLQKLARDLPVTFVVNADRRTILAYLAEAKLFWQTAGLGGEGRVAPRYMEHFGMATVEAMMSGCVPLVPACGGPAEIVEHGVNGFHCSGLDALVRHSVLLASEDSLRIQMSQRAMEQSNMFCPAVFDQRFGQCILESVERLGQRDKCDVREAVSSPSVM